MLPSICFIRGGVLIFCICIIRETRDGCGVVAPAKRWNWDEWGLKEYKLKGSFIGWYVGFVVPVQEICNLLGFSIVNPVQNIFFLTSIFPHRPAIWAGSQAGSPVFWYVSLTLMLRKYFSKGRWVQHAWASNTISTLSVAEKNNYGKTTHAISSVFFSLLPKNWFLLSTR